MVGFLSRLAKFFSIMYKIMENKKEFRQISELFEGIVSIRSLIKAMEDKVSDRRIITLYYNEKNTVSNKSEYAWLRHRAEDFGFLIEICDEAFFEENTVGNTHGGVAAKCSERSFPSPEFYPDNIKNKSFFVMLDGIEDPYNFGYALRTFYAAGVDGVILPPRNRMVTAGIVCRASAGASELMPMYCLETDKAADFMKSKGFTVVCADLRDSVPVYEASLRYPLFLIVGGEKRGISRAVLEKSDVRVRLDYARDFNASLSAASAASVIAYEIYRQNKYENAK